MTTNARKEAGLVNPETGDYLELDIFLPSLNLAFEYQERHHYLNTGKGYQPLETVLDRDLQKTRLAREQGITLVRIPFWWDGRIDRCTSPRNRPSTNICISSLAATINALTGQVLNRGTAKPIPDEIPEHLRVPDRVDVPDIGQPVTACFFLQSDLDPKDWCVPCVVIWPLIMSL